MWEINYFNSLVTLAFFAILFGTAKFILSYTRSKDIKHVNLLKNIDQKMFMTIWLGSWFACIFLILIFLASHYLNKNFLLNAFAYGKENPGAFFYLAGALFSSTTILIYVVRRIGIYVYLRMEKADKTNRT